MGGAAQDTAAAGRLQRAPEQQHRISLRKPSGGGGEAGTGCKYPLRDRRVRRGDDSICSPASLAACPPSPSPSPAQVALLRAWRRRAVEGGWMEIGGGLRENCSPDRFLHMSDSAECRGRWPPVCRVTSSSSSWTRRTCGRFV